MNKNYLYNEGSTNRIKIYKGNKKFIFFKKKKYLDLSYASGSLLLGHNSNILKKTIKKQINIGTNFSHPNIFSYKFSLLLRKIFKEYSKFVFCVSGTEANMKVLRIARAISNKKKIAMVHGSWHGSVDELLYSVNQKYQNIFPVSSGINKNKNIVILPYNNFLKTKKILDNEYKNISLLIIEPIQQVIPDYNNEKYLLDLIKYCNKKKIKLCFDEMVTGLRLPQLTVQNKLKIFPEFMTLGKIFGGGMPIGIIALHKTIVKKYDQKIKKIFFGGTYSLNPMSYHVGMETVKYILQNRIKIFNKVNCLAKFLSDELNKFLIKNNLDIKIYRYNSIIRIIYSKKLVTNKHQKELAEKSKLKSILDFKRYIFKKNIFCSENGAIFLSYENNLKDIKYILSVFNKGFKKYFS
jgi:glutamate-1-semialdehyde 2,1-aminomutase